MPTYQQLEEVKRPVKDFSSDLGFAEKTKGGFNYKILFIADKGLHPLKGVVESPDGFWDIQEWRKCGQPAGHDDRRLIPVN